MTPDPDADADVGVGGWPLGPFTRRGQVLGTLPDVSFDCPVQGGLVRWAAKDVFNPAAVVHDGRVHLLFRAEDQVGRYNGTSRIGLAVSDDGVTFAAGPEPVLFPDDDPWQAWEWPGGCEDPRVVEAPDGSFVCLYTAFDGKHGCLCVATSPDLRVWTKHGPAFAGTPQARLWSKSGAVVTEVRDGRLVAAEIGGRYWMYWGEGICFAATSDDLVHWTPLTFEVPDRYLTHQADTGSWSLHRVAGGPPTLRPLLFPRPGRFDSLLVEPGPPALRTEAGVLLVYNGANHPSTGDPSLPAFAYQPGQALFDANDPASCIARTGQPFLRAEGADEQQGQVDQVCFAQSLVLFGGEWLLYFGMADSRIGCAAAPLTS